MAPALAAPIAAGQPVNPSFTCRLQASNMKKIAFMRNMIRSGTLAFALAAAAAAQAAELSPWLGSEDQIPFQLDPVTMVAVTFAADPLQTGSVSKAPCLPETCLTGTNTATEASNAIGAPQY
jgi:hypothetical protein